MLSFYMIFIYKTLADSQYDILNSKTNCNTKFLIHKKYKFACLEFCHKLHNFNFWKFRPCLFTNCVYSSHCWNWNKWERLVAMGYHWEWKVVNMVCFAMKGEWIFTFYKIAFPLAQVHFCSYKFIALTFPSYQSSFLSMTLFTST